jgi:hypothetical protein
MVSTISLKDAAVVLAFGRRSYFRWAAVISITYSWQGSAANFFDTF